MFPIFGLVKEVPPLRHVGMLQRAGGDGANLFEFFEKYHRSESPLRHGHGCCWKFVEHIDYTAFDDSESYAGASLYFLLEDPSPLAAARIGRRAFRRKPCNGASAHGRADFQWKGFSGSGYL